MDEANDGASDERADEWTNTEQERRADGELDRKTIEETKEQSQRRRNGSSNERKCGKNDGRRDWGTDIRGTEGRTDGRTGREGQRRKEKEEKGEETEAKAEEGKNKKKETKQKQKPKTLLENKKLYEFPGGNQVDGLPPALSNTGLAGS